MAGIDQDKIHSIILELSKHSAYTRRQLKLDAKVDARIALIRDKLGALSDAARRAIARRVEHRVHELEQTRHANEFDIHKPGPCRSFTTRKLYTGKFKWF